jgi:hypothetical protein
VAGQLLTNGLPEPEHIADELKADWVKTFLDDQVESD